MKRHGRIRFASRSMLPRPDAGCGITGNLELHGVTRSISFEIRREGDRQVAEVERHQPDYGIVPYEAMLGTLEVKPEVRVRVSGPNT